jgi:hypothetical protein
LANPYIWGVDNVANYMSAVKQKAWPYILHGFSEALSADKQLPQLVKLSNFGNFPKKVRVGAGTASTFS